MINLQDDLNRIQRLMQALLSQYLPTHQDPLSKAMQYACLNGGKRLRPLLVFYTGQIFGVSESLLNPIAVAIELIHCYSLVHDDLPAMDNDDLRRGKPTCHKVFDEATAILAGDALLTLAFEIISHPEHLAELDQLAILKIIRVLAKASGSQGMVKGQAIDLNAQGKNLNLDNLIQMHRAKTGALMTASVQCGALASTKATDQDLIELSKFGEALGLCFQIQDDILDAQGNTEKLGKKTGQDVKNQKCTFVTILGAQAAKEHALHWQQQAQLCLAHFGEKGAPLRALTTYMLERTM